MHLSRLSVLLAPAVIVGLFGSTLIGVDRLAFRDVSHFYTPLYEYVGERSMQSWLPAWNPLDQTGIPLLGETTTAFFYPVRYLLFALPVSAEVAMGWYIAVHLVLASIAATIAARWAGVGRQSATIAGVVYPLSGSLIGLYINPPFLVGAAWLPLAVGALLGERPKSQVMRSLIAAVAMAMMVLGGDPQTALHTMIIAGGVWAAHVVLRSRGYWPEAMAKWLGRIGVSRAAGPRLATLVAAPLIAMALSAPQIAASLSWSRHSERLESSGSAAWWQPPATDSRRHQAYQFSLPPWHLAGLATPTPWGSFLPQYRRLSVLFPGDGRMWTFSIYPGLLASLALLSRLSGWRRDGIDRWSALAVAALLFSLGHFGLVWWLQNMTGQFAHVDSALGGAYWLLYHLVPGYDLFRYPAKWLPVFSLAAAIITAQWLDGAAWKRPAAIRWVYVALLGAVLVAAACVALLRIDFGWIQPAQESLPTDRFWGPLDMAGGLREIQFSLIHSLGVLAAIGILLYAATWGFRWEGRFSRRTMVTSLMIALAAVDLTAAARHWIKSVDIQREQTLVAQLEPASNFHRWLRTQSDGGWPEAWRSDAGARRLMEVEASQRAAWMGRWHLADRQAVLNSMTSIQSHEIESFWRATAQITRGMPPQERSEFWRAVKRWLAIGGESHTTGRSVEARQAGYRYQLVDLHRLSDRAAPSGLRFHPRWKVAGPASGEQWSRLLSDVRRHAEFTVPRVTDERPPSGLPNASSGRVARQERGKSEPPASAAGENTNAAARGEDLEPADDTSGLRRRGAVGHRAIRVEAESPDWIELTLTAKTAGLLTRRVYQDGHWRARIKPLGGERWQPATVHSVDHLAQGILLPPGSWRIQVVYHPAWLRPAVFFSLAAWACCICLLATASWRHLR